MAMVGSECLNSLEFGKNSRLTMLEGVGFGVEICLEHLFKDLFECDSLGE